MPDPSFASLSPSLLARKGGAKPAMRPQHAALATMPGSSPAEDHDKLEDLGWNDMGSDGDDAPHTAEVVALPSAPRTPAPFEAPFEAPVAAPEVLRQRDAIAERIAPRASTALPRDVQRPATRARKDRAAFTLRLDTDRHIKLRLACTIHGVSAQALVTEALDTYLAAMPELATLAAQVKRR